MLWSLLDVESDKESAVTPTENNGNWHFYLFILTHL